MGVRGQQEDFVWLKSVPMEFLADPIGKFGPDDHEIEAEDQTAGIAAFQEEGGDLDRIEDVSGRGLARRITGKPDLTVAWGDIA